MSKIMYKGISYANAGVSSDATSIPTADMTAAFDNTAHMNSEDMSAQDISDFVDGLDPQGGGVADYVVEQGISDMWTYRKWNSGIAECWGTATHSVTSWSSWYGWFYSEPYNVSHDYPTNLFNAAPTLTVTWGSGVVGLPLGEGSPTKDRTGYWYIIRPSSATGSYSLCFHAIGKWK